MHIWMLFSHYPVLTLFGLHAQASWLTEEHLQPGGLGVHKLVGICSGPMRCEWPGTQGGSLTPEV